MGKIDKIKFKATIGSLHTMAGTKLRKFPLFLNDVSSLKTVKYFATQIPNKVKSGGF